MWRLALVLVMTLLACNSALTDFAVVEHDAEPAAPEFDASLPPSDMDAGSEPAMPPVEEPTLPTVPEDAAVPNDDEDAAPSEPSEPGEPPEVEDAGPACEPTCITGGMCGSSDGCGGVCLGRCEDDYEQVCHGGICNSDSWCPMAACDLWSATGCTAGQSCYRVNADGEDTQIACRAPGSSASGSACSHDTECGTNHGCVFGRCEPFCCRGGNDVTEPSTECAYGRQCHRIDDTVIGFCLRSCSMWDHSACAESEICIFGDFYLGYCAPQTGRGAREGEECTYANDCIRGLYCDGATHTCLRPCSAGSTAAPCEADETCRSIGRWPYGVCE